MAMLRGVPITESFDSHKLRTGERVALFIPVCRAIRHTCRDAATEAKAP
jgi:hypothetical protein